MNDRMVNQPSQSVQKWVQVFTHFLCLCIIFILPDVLMSHSVPDRPAPWPMYLRSAMFVGVFYLNYYVIIDKCIGRKRWLLQLIAWNLLVLVFVLSITVIFWHGGAKHHAPDYLVSSYEKILWKLSFLIRDAVMVILTVAFSVAMKLSDGLVKSRHKQQELEKITYEQELTSLKNQLNPHFLFNTLNSIYALIEVNQACAQKAIHELSGLLRYVLYENSASVSIRQELAFVENYVKLIKLRLDPEFPVRLLLDAGDCGDMPVAPLIFISPVENAFKYGNTGSPDDYIEISIICTNGILECRIANHYDVNRQNAASRTSSGIGNVNLTRRLQLIYGSDAMLTTSDYDGNYIVNLKINLKNYHEHATLLCGRR